VAPGKIDVLGNLKYDRKPSAAAGKGEETRDLTGWSRDRGHVILAAGCTHPGEEALICSLLDKLRALEPRLRLILAPRHVERLKAGEKPDWGWSGVLARWSDVRSRPPPEGLGDAVLLVDTVGELERFYAMADLVVVGGSFVPRGGHNLLEPTRLGKPTCFGPHCENFRDEAEHLLRHRAAVCAQDGAELEACLLAWLRAPSLRAELGERARQAVAKLQGAASRHAEWIERQLSLSLPAAS
jgi:3-deoxy-D-manno-octulosonic-acid transferase